LLCDLVDETLNRLPAFQLACFILTRRPGTSRRKWDLPHVRCAHRIPHPVLMENKMALQA
jgi:hypothetical protein